MLHRNEKNIVMKKFSPKILWILGILIIFAFVEVLDYFFDFDQKIVHYSDNIRESKKNNVFVRTIKLDSVVLKSSPPHLKILSFSGWIENATTYKGTKIKEIDTTSFMVIFDFKLEKKLELNEKNYVDTWDIDYDKNNSIGGLFSGSNIRGNFRINKAAIEKPIELEIIKFPSKYHPNNGKVIGYLKIK
jgi:hypothetical protein